MLPFRMAAPPSRARGAAAALALLLLPAAELDAQASSVSLGRTVEHIGAAWARAEAGSIVAHASPEGLMLELEGDAVGPVTGRQAAAELRRLFERRETVGMRIGVARVIGGSPARAFGELTWTFRVEGTTIPETRTVFLALVEEDGAWRLTQIRVLR